MKKRYAHKDNVLLVNITRLGDMLQATPTLAGMKMENPNCKITVLVEKQFADVCKILPNVDEVVGIDLSMAVRGLSRAMDGIVDAYEYVSEVVDKLRAESFDYCLNMSSSAYTAMLLKMLRIPRNGGWNSDEQGFRIIESDWARLFATSVFHQNRQYNSLNLVDVFRCSADVDTHPRQLLINIEPEAETFVEELIAGAGFTNTGPLVCIQAGASQAKRQWATRHFVQLCKILVEKYNARIVLTGTKKELPIVEPIAQGCGTSNVFVGAGKTDIPQLAALLHLSEVLVTGDTGPMHIAVAAGTPVISMFLASAFGFETGPYSEGNLVLQPVISCGPCNPNKACARPDCHDHISAELVAELTALRMQGEVLSVPQELADPSRVIIYRTVFDEFGFLDMEPLNQRRTPQIQRFRQAYRKLWLSTLGGFPIAAAPAGSPLKIIEDLPGLAEVAQYGQTGARLIDRLVELIKDQTAPARLLGEVNEQLSALDRQIEEIGFHHAPLGPLTRMFVFSKENLSGTEALELASQMKSNYQDLSDRACKLGEFYQEH